MPSSPLASFPISGKPIEKMRYIRDMLTLAKDSRVYVFLDFVMHKRVLFQLKGSFQDVRGDRLYLYLREDVEKMPKPGMEVNVYFSLRSNHKAMPFSFSSSLLDTEQHNRDQFLILSIPEVMSHQQRRYNVRINVHKSDIDDFKVWFGQPSTEGKMDWTPINSDYIEIYDISAGGMQIGISQDSPIHPLLSRQSNFLISGKFFIKGKDVSPLIMASNVVRLESDRERRVTVLGISYQQWAKIGDEGLHWVNMTSQDGVAPLAAWVFQAIMERFKVDRNGGPVGN